MLLINSLYFSKINFIVLRDYHHNYCCLYYIIVILTHFEKFYYKYIVINCTHIYIYMFYVPLYVILYLLDELIKIIFDIRVFFFVSSYYD